MDILSELKCCKLCGAFKTCNHKGECCIECRYFDPVDMMCLAPLKKKKQAEEREKEEDTFNSDVIDPQTFLFEDDDDLFEDDEEELEEADFYDDEDEYDDLDDDWD